MAEVIAALPTGRDNIEGIYSIPPWEPFGVPSLLASVTLALANG